MKVERGLPSAAEFRAALPLNSCSFQRPNASAFQSFEAVNDCCCFCFCSLLESARRMCWTGGVRHRAHPQLSQRRGQNPRATPSAQGQSASLSPTISQHGATLRTDSGRRALETASVLQSCDGVGKLRGRIRDLGGRQVCRHRSLPGTLPRARADLRLQSTPAAAPTDQPHYPDSSRMVCHSRSGSMRTGTPSSHQDHCAGNPGVLAENGTWNASLRFARALTEVCYSLKQSFSLDLGAWRLKQRKKSVRNKRTTACYS